MHAGRGANINSAFSFGGRKFCGLGENEAANRLIVCRKQSKWRRKTEVVSLLQPQKMHNTNQVMYSYSLDFRQNGW